MWLHYLPMFLRDNMADENLYKDLIQKDGVDFQATPENSPVEIVEDRLSMPMPEYQQVPSHSRSIESSPAIDTVRETFRDLISSQGLERAQGQDLDNIGNILGQRRMHNWPGGIGRAIEPDDQYRNRLTSNINAYRASQNADSRLRDAIASHLPAGLSLNDIQITQSETDPNQIDINLQLQPPPGAQHVALEIETEDESKIPDDIDRWQQIADEL